VIRTFFKYVILILLLPLFALSLLFAALTSTLSFVWRDYD